MKKLLISVGAQGTGNHIFARCFSMHPDVLGWEELKDHYFIKHARDIFVENWIYPQLMEKSYFNDYDYISVNTSFPVNFEGVRYNPKVIEVARRAAEWGIDVRIAVITRDYGITQFQQQRTREGETANEFIKYVKEILLPSEFPVHFINLEAFFIYKKDYLKNISKMIDFPIDTSHPDILKFIKESPNEKYLKYVDDYWLDEVNRQGTTESQWSDPATVIESTNVNTTVISEKKDD